MLPNEILHELFSYIDILQRMGIARVCRLWNYLINTFYINKDEFQSLIIKLGDPSFCKFNHKSSELYVQSSFTFGSERFNPKHLPSYINHMTFVERAWISLFFGDLTDSKNSLHLIE